MQIDKSKAAIQLKQISKTFNVGKNEVEAVRDVSLTISAGRFIAIMGSSGSGKSTLLHIMGGLTTPTNGSISVYGQALHDKSDKELTLFRRTHIGLIFQAFNLLPTMNAIQNVSLPRVIAGENMNAVREDAEKMLKLVGLEQRIHHSPDEMSGGQQQRVAIARALVGQAPIILADEPTGNLDSKTGEKILLLLKQLVSKTKRTIVMVTHDPKAAAYADEVITMTDGQIVEQLMTSSEVF